MANEKVMHELNENEDKVDKKLFNSDHVGITKTTHGEDDLKIESFRVENNDKNINAKDKERDTGAMADVQLQDIEKSAKDELQEKLKNGIKNVMDSNNFKNWCDTASKLYLNKYSFNNAMLVYIQNPNATHTMGYQEWKNYGRQVMQGAKSILIFAPNYYKDTNGKGSFLKYIKSYIQNQFKNSPSLEYAHYDFTNAKIGINGYKNGLYDITFNGNVIKGKITEETLRRFLDEKIIGKVVSHFSIASVFDVEETVTPEVLWVKSGYNKSELALDKNDDIVKNKRGEVKIYNTQERKGKYVPNLDFSIKESDPEKMKILFDVLCDVSNKKNVPVTVEPLEEGTDGYFLPKDNRIVIADNLSPTGNVATLFHEMTHADLHGLKDGLNSEMREVQAEAVAYMTAKNFGIETATSSFNYIASWSNGRDLKELEQSLSVIWNQSLKLMTEIKSVLDERGMDMTLEQANQEPLDKDLLYNIISENKDYILNESAKIREIREEANQDYKSFSDSEQKVLIEMQVSICNEQAKILNSMDKALNELQDSSNKNVQLHLLNKINSYKDQYIETEIQFVDLSKERIEKIREKAKELKDNVKDKYLSDPIKTLKEFSEQYPVMKDLTENDFKYMANSKYISRAYSQYIGGNNEKFIEKSMEQLEKTKMVQSKNGTIVEISTCEKWSEESIFVNGTVAHPTTANKIFEQAEKQVRKLRIIAESKGEYYPYHKCDVNIYTPYKDTITAFYIRVDIGDGEQKNLLNNLEQVCSTRGKNKDEKENLLNNFKDSLNEKVRGKLIEPHNEVEINENRENRSSFQDWKNAVKNAKQQSDNEDNLTEEKGKEKDNTKDERSE